MTEHITPDSGTFQEQKKRSTFLTVLCILTFIASGYAISVQVWHLFTKEQQVAKAQEQAALMESSASQIPDGFWKEFTTASVDFAIFSAENTTFGLIGLFCALISLTGAILMWNFKKEGFYIYTIINLIALFLPMIFIGVNPFTIVITSVIGIITLLFIILYGVNLKHMS